MPQLSLFLLIFAAACLLALVSMWVQKADKVETGIMAGTGGLSLAGALLAWANA
ncbi:hypothetical protein [Chitinibacter tainanensis]|uniref:hypothetical protein n=1 Tax=Chitinibacter tainanensis TaxID=230667 RepID=UPI002355CCBB|nr:hypothetical protein [Chitinibacter tainanensis]